MTTTKKSGEYITQRTNDINSYKEQLRIIEEPILYLYSDVNGKETGGVGVLYDKQEIEKAIVIDQFNQPVSKEEKLRWLQRVEDETNRLMREEGKPTGPTGNIKINRPAPYYEFLSYDPKTKKELRFDPGYIDRQFDQKAIEKYDRVKFHYDKKNGEGSFNKLMPRGRQFFGLSAYNFGAKGAVDRFGESVQKGDYIKAAREVVKAGRKFNVAEDKNKLHQRYAVEAAREQKAIDPLGWIPTQPNEQEQEIFDRYELSDELHNVEFVNKNKRDLNPPHTDFPNVSRNETVAEQLRPDQEWIVESRPGAAIAREDKQNHSDLPVDQHQHSLSEQLQPQEKMILQSRPGDSIARQGEKHVEQQALPTSRFVGIFDKNGELQTHPRIADTGELSRQERADFEELQAIQLGLGMGSLPREDMDNDFDGGFTHQGRPVRAFGYVKDKAGKPATVVLLPQEKPAQSKVPHTLLEAALSGLPGYDAAMQRAGKKGVAGAAAAGGPVGKRPTALAASMPSLRQPGQTAFEALSQQARSFNPIGFDNPDVSRQEASVLYDEHFGKRADTTMRDILTSKTSPFHARAMKNKDRLRRRIDEEETRSGQRKLADTFRRSPEGSLLV